MFTLQNSQSLLNGGDFMTIFSIVGSTGRYRKCPGNKNEKDYIIFLLAVVEAGLKVKVMRQRIIILYIFLDYLNTPGPIWKILPLFKRIYLLPTLLLLYAFNGNRLWFFNNQH